MIRLIFAVGCLSVAVALSVPALAQEQVPNPVPDPCFSTHTAGSGKEMIRVCISDRGNILGFESPKGFQQIGMGEGYVLCSANGAVVHGYDAGFMEAGFGLPIITQPNGPDTFPLIISRETHDGVFVLTQVFSWNEIQKEVMIEMTIENTSDVKMSDVRLVRYFHHAIREGDNPQKSYCARTRDSILAFGDGSKRNGIALVGEKFSKNTSVESLLDWSSTSYSGCQAISQSTPANGGGNYVGRIEYAIGSIKSGKDKTLSFVYRRL